MRYLVARVVSRWWRIVAISLEGVVEELATQAPRRAALWRPLVVDFEVYGEGTPCEILPGAAGWMDSERPP